MVDTECAFCGKTIARSPRRMEIAKKHFCSTDHYVKYKRKYNYYNHTQKISAYQKIQELAHEIKQRKEVIK